MSKEILKLVHGDITNEARREVKPKYVGYDHAVFTVDYEMDSDLVDQLDTDAHFVAKMRGDIMKLYEELVAEFAKRWAEAEHVASKEPLSSQELKDFQHDVATMFDKYRKSIEAKADDHVKRWLQVRKDRKDYTHDVAFKVVVGTASALGGGFSAVTGIATMGVSFVTGLIGLVKGLSKLWTEYRRVAADVDQAHKKVVDTIADLQKAYEGKSDRGVGWREAGKTALADFLVVQMATIKRADVEFMTYKGKVAPLHEHTAALGRALNALLDKQVQIDHKIVEELKVAMKKENRRSDKFDRFIGAMEQSRAEVQKLIAGIEKMHPILASHDKFTDDLAAALADLHARKPTFAKGLEIASKVLSIAASPTVTAIATHGDNLRKIADVLESGYEAFAKEVGA